MPSLQIREMPEDVYLALSERASREGRSLAQQALHELRKLPELEAAERRRAVVERVRKRDSVLATGAMDAVDLIREDRDA